MSILEHYTARSGGKTMSPGLKLEMIVMSFLYSALFVGSRTCSSSLPGYGSTEFQCSGHLAGHSHIFANRLVVSNSTLQRARMERPDLPKPKRNLTFVLQPTATLGLCSWMLIILLDHGRAGSSFQAAEQRDHPCSLAFQIAAEPTEERE